MAAYTTDVREYFKPLIIANQVINYSFVNFKLNSTKKQIQLYEFREFVLKLLHFFIKTSVFVGLLLLTWFITSEQDPIDGFLLFIDCLTYIILIIDVLYNFQRYKHFESIISELKLLNIELEYSSRIILNKSVQYKKSCFTHCVIILLIKYLLVITFDSLTYFEHPLNKSSKFIFFNIGHIFIFLNEVHLLTLEVDVYKKYIILNDLLENIGFDNFRVHILIKLRSANRHLAVVQWEVDRMFGYFLLTKWLLAFNGLLQFPYNTIAGTETIAGFVWSTAFLIDVLWHLVCVERIKNQVTYNNITSIISTHQ